MDKITFWDGLSAILPMIGAGGITAIVVAYFGSRRPVTVASPAVQQSAMGFQALLADHVSMERFSGEVRRLADANERIATGIERYCNLLDITQALDRIGPRRRRRRNADPG